MSSRLLRNGLILWAMVVATLFAAPAALAAPDVVTNTSDSASTVGSLPYEVANAAAGDTITFASGLDGQTITLTSPIEIDQDLTIQGPGASELTISGDNTSQIFTICVTNSCSAANVSIGGLSLTAGAATYGGAVEDEDSGSLIITDSTFDADTAGGQGGGGTQSGVGYGGAIEDEDSGSLTITDSTFDADTAGGQGGGGTLSGVGYGGAIEDEDSGSLTITDSTFDADTAGGQGGGGTQSGAGYGGAVEDVESGSLTITDSTFDADTAGGQGGGGPQSGVGFGGAIDEEVSSEAVLTDSTLTGGAAGGPAGGGFNSGRGFGGAMSLSDVDAATLSGDTIDQNSASYAGSGVYGASLVDAEATIVAGNTGSTNCDANVASSSYSLEYGDGAPEDSCGFNALQVSQSDPLLGPLQDNGGPTETQPLPAGSPAVDVVPRGQADCPASGESTDQRGDPRPGAGESGCSVGAYEYQVAAPGQFVFPASISEPSSSQNPSSTGQQVTFTVTVSPVPHGGTVEFTEDGIPIAGCGQVPVDTTTGEATCTTTFAGPGSYQIQAVYSGDSSYTDATSPVLVQVVTVPGSRPPTPTPTPTTLALHSPGAAVTGQSVTYTATVAPTPAGGTVEFLRDGKPIPGCRSVALHDGKATCKTTYGRPGHYGIQAVYSGAAGLTGSRSGTLSQPISLSAKLIGGPALHGRRLSFTIACAKASGGCRIIARVRIGKTLTDHIWTLPAGTRRKLTITLEHAPSGKVGLQITLTTAGQNNTITTRTLHT